MKNKSSHYREQNILTALPASVIIIVFVHTRPTYGAFAAVRFHIYYFGLALLFLLAPSGGLLYFSPTPSSAQLGRSRSTQPPPHAVVAAAALSTVRTVA
jgi:hypothetical protein